MNNVYLRLALPFMAVGVLAIAAFARPTPTPAATRSLAVVQSIDTYRTATWRWQRLTGAPRTPTVFSERRTQAASYRVWVRDLWRTRLAIAYRRAARPPHRAAWQCIHRYERSPAQGWRTNTGNGYYGGLQMDISFQRHYGRELLARKGTADRWSSLEQMWVAERAYQSGRGFYPWPNTARYCGLI